MRVFFILVFHSAFALFPGRAPDEGDVRHLYPISSIAIGLTDHAHILPYLLGTLENIDYPKSRIHLELHLLGKEDTTREQVLWWKLSVSSLFASVSVVQDAENWEETALRNARLKKSSTVLISTGNNLIRNEKILQTLSSKKNHVIVTALMRAAGQEEPVNIEAVPEGEEPRKEIFSAYFPMLIQLSEMDSSYLTFDSQNLPNFQGSDESLDVFYESARRMSVKIHLDSGHYHGVYFTDLLDLPHQRRLVRVLLQVSLRFQLRYHLCDLIANDAALPTYSRTVRPWTPDADLWNVDRIYLINLKRRPDRLKKMIKIFEVLGVNYTLLEATDGYRLPSDVSITPIPGYEDPITKRPLKTGEIGCFLSHYRIWKEVIGEKLERVIVFEDDLRFSLDGMERVKEVLEDLDASRRDWDLIYLGRKKMDVKEEQWIPLHRHLSTVGYSYWTLGYLLSYSGAEKLLAPNPLNRLVPVDEYLPIMFDRHPREDWMTHFPTRNLDAYTLYPLVVFPQKYTHEVGYVTDTENSSLYTVPAPSKDEL